MNNELDDLKFLWKEAAPAVGSRQPIPDIIEKAIAKRKSSLYFQWSNILILTATAVVIYIFLWRLYPYNNILSKTAVLAMISSLAVRIIIELFSIRKWAGIRVDADTLDNTRATLDYYQFRKFVHGPVTYSIVAIYTIAFYCLIPEFSAHVPLWLTLLICIGYPIGAFILISQIRKGIRKELEDIVAISSLSKSLQEHTA
ncbi:MAG: hypothetical protein KIT80_05935 [Chitinophagaceae bacterium]|nr:hypothetical protein [Chitinophagaceae bacterium]MCW5926433.1 hypothetical protein [Chitinophagaceae bacterium]